MSAVNNAAKLLRGKEMALVSTRELDLQLISFDSVEIDENGSEDNNVTGHCQRASFPLYHCRVGQNKRQTEGGNDGAGGEEDAHFCSSAGVKGITGGQAS